MPLFEYKAADGEGESVRGTLAAASTAAAAVELEKRGLKVEHLGEVENPHDPIPKEFGREGEATQQAPPTEQRAYVQTHVVGQMIGRVPLPELAFFFRQMSTMLKAGVGMVQSLDTLAGQQRHPNMVGVLREMKEHAQAGRPLSVGMQRYPEIFSPLILGLVRAGEASGMLDEILGQCSDYLEREIKLRLLIKRLTFYPKMVLVASVIIIWSANQILNMVGGKPIWSPLTSPGTWCFLLPVLGGLYVFNRLVLPNPLMKERWDQLVAHLPYIGVTVRQLSLAKFSRAMAALYRGGVGLPKATLLSADACGNGYIRAGLYPAAKRLEEGQGLWESFVATGVVNPIVLDMIRTGEHTGNLDLMLDKVAEYYESDAEVRVTISANVLGLVAFLFVAAYVFVVIFTFYSGIFASYSAAAGG